MMKKIIIAIIIISVIVISVAVYVGVNYKKIFLGKGFELPEGTIEFIEIGKNYENAYNPIEINGKLAYIAQKRTDDTLKDIIVYGEEEIILDYENVKIDCLANVDDKLTYTVEYSDASDNYQKHRYIQHGEEKLSFDDYIFDGYPMLRGTRVRYCTAESKGNGIIVKKDEIKEANEINIRGVFNGKLLYEAGPPWVIIWGDKEIYSNGMEGVTKCSLVNNKIALEIMKCVADGPCVSGIVYDGKIIHKPQIVHWIAPGEVIYISASNPVEWNNELTYIATTSEHVDVIVSGKEEISPKYSQIKGLNIINGKLTYIAFDDSKRKYKVIYDGEQLGGYYDFINNYEMVGIENKIAFVAGEKDKGFIVYDGKEIGKEYNAVRLYLTSFKNKLVFQITEWDSKDRKKEPKTFIVVEK